MPDYRMPLQKKKSGSTESKQGKKKRKKETHETVTFNCWGKEKNHRLLEERVQERGRKPSVIETKGGKKRGRYG